MSRSNPLFFMFFSVLLHILLGGGIYFVVFFNSSGLAIPEIQLSMEIADNNDDFGTKSSSISPLMQKKGQVKQMESGTEVYPGELAAGGQFSPQVIAKINADMQNHVSYPPVARKMGWSGSVLILVSIDTAGRAESVEIEQSSGFEILDQNSLKMAREWRYGRYIHNREGFHLKKERFKLRFDYRLK